MIDACWCVCVLARLILRCTRCRIVSPIPPHCRCDALTLAALHCTALHCAALYCTALRYIALLRSVHYVQRRSAWQRGRQEASSDWLCGSMSLLVVGPQCCNVRCRETAAAMRAPRAAPQSRRRTYCSALSAPPAARRSARPRAAAAHPPRTVPTARTAAKPNGRRHTNGEQASSAAWTNGHQCGGK